MSTIVTRAGKGSELTWNEVDANFSNLNTDKIQSGDTVSALTITTATLQDSTDNTKKLNFGLSNIPTGTTNTYTFPATAGQIAVLTAQNTFAANTNTFGSSTATGTTGLASGATLNGNTKTVNIGTSGVSGSTTTISIGSSVSGATSNTTLNGTTTLVGLKETVFTITDGAAFEINPANGGIQLVTLGASRTPKGTNFTTGQSVTLMVDDGTAFTLTWTDATFGSGGVKWVGGTAPTLATTGYTVIELWEVGTQVYGAYVGTVA